MLPVSAVTQTIGSIVRPASYRSIFGYKPTFDSIPRAGVLPLCPSLDHVGLFARTVEDLELFAKVFTRTDPCQPSIRAAQAVDLDLLRGPDELDGPGIAFVKTPQWPELDESTRHRLKETVARLDERDADIEVISLPEKFAGLVGAQAKIF